MKKKHNTKQSTLEGEVWETYSAGFSGKIPFIQVSNYFRVRVEDRPGVYKYKELQSGRQTYARGYSISRARVSDIFGGKMLAIPKVSSIVDEIAKLPLKKVHLMMLALWWDGITVKEIAARFGMKDSDVAAAIRNAGSILTKWYRNKS